MLFRFAETFTEEAAISVNILVGNDIDLVVFVVSNNHKPEAIPVIRFAVLHLAGIKAFYLFHCSADMWEKLQYLGSGHSRLGPVPFRRISGPRKIYEIRKRQ